MGDNNNFSFYPKPQSMVSVMGSNPQPTAAASALPPWVNTSGQSVMPKSSSSIPQAASNNSSIKPYTNGGWNVAQTSALISGALGMMADYTNSRYQSRALMAQATAYDNQIPLNYAAYRTNVNYLAERNFASVSKIIDEGNAFMGAQMAQIAGAGWDMSAGEQRIPKDTYGKMTSDIYLENRSAYLQSFELWRNTEMENARLLAAAASARSQAKYLKKVRKINLISGSVSTAAGVMAAAYGPKLPTRNV